MDNQSSAPCSDSDNSSDGEWATEAALAASVHQSLSASSSRVHQSIELLGIQIRLPSPAFAFYLLRAWPNAPIRQRRTVTAGWRLLSSLVHQTEAHPTPLFVAHGQLNTHTHTRQSFIRTLGSRHSEATVVMSKRKAEQMASAPAGDFARHDSATPEGGAAAAAAAGAGDEDTACVTEKAAPTRRGGRQAAVAEIRPAQIEAQKRVATLVSFHEGGATRMCQSCICVEAAIWSPSTIGCFPS